MQKAQREWRVCSYACSIPLQRVTGIMHGKRGEKKNPERGGCGKTIKRETKTKAPSKRETVGARCSKGVRERNETSSWDVNSSARVCRRRGTEYFVLAREVSLSTTGAHMHQATAERRGVKGGREEERRNSVHSEAFGREVCSACTLHSRAVHNS